MIWTPHVTVAAIIERDGKFLLIEEDSEGEYVFNQPAGHWEPGETLVQACAREALEESACRFVPRDLVGVYSWRHASADITYLRFAYGGEIEGFDSGRTLDAGITRAVWMDIGEMQANASRLRSPLVLLCVQDYLAGRRHPLTLVTHVD